MSVTVYGASDDLIEVEGDIREEFTPHGDNAYLAFSNGIVIHVEYTRSGIWRITPVVSIVSGQLHPPLSIVQAPEDDEENYSDRATIDGTIEWVVLGSGWAKAK